MKRIFLVVMMLMIIPSFAQIGKGKKKKEKQNTECVAETGPVKPLKRERWIERDGQDYVIVTRTTISSNDYQRIKNINK
jgi:hypothetical protein